MTIRSKWSKQSVPTAPGYLRFLIDIEKAIYACINAVIIFSAIPTKREAYTEKCILTTSINAVKLCVCDPGKETENVRKEKHGQKLTSIKRRTEILST